MSLDAAERAVRDGDLDAALRDLQEQIRQRPADAKLRVFLFQLLCVLGQWERALTQLNVAADLDAQALGMAQMYRDAVKCEMLRGGVFAGERSPLIFGEPAEWLALLIESLLVTGTPRSGEAQSLRERAFAAAPTSSGAVDGTPFEWIADADMRLGPVCEAVINGRYYWVPFERLTKIDLEAPADLRDIVWTPAHFQFSNGGDAVGLIPTRYPGSESAEDGQVRLARKTEWHEVSPDVFTGQGQRQFSTDAGDHPVMDIRSITLGPQPTSEPGAANA
jgi:type VI secretion system protein ImpE